MKNSTKTKSKIKIIKEIKIIPKNLASFAAKNKSDKKSRMTASQKKEKYAIPIKAKMADTQKGIKSTENKSVIEAKIRNAICNVVIKK